MLIATKKNRQLRIPDAKQKEYESLGYTIKNPDGTLVFQPVNAEKELAALKIENAALREELAVLKVATDSASVAVATSEDEAAAVVTNEEAAQVEPETQTTAKRATKKKAAATGE